MALVTALFDLLFLTLLFGNGNVSATETNITFLPEEVSRLFENADVTVQFNITTDLDLRTTSYSVSAKAEDEVIAIVVANITQRIEDLEEIDDGHYGGEITIRGRRLGRTDIEFFVHETNTAPTDEHLVENNLNVVVIRNRRLVDSIYRYGIIILVSLLYVGFGCKIDLKAVWEILKKPISPAIGIISQFVIMPLLGFGLGQIFGLEDALGFGLLTLACSPGGGSSNIYVSLFDGNLDLSLTMTTISTFASLGMMPMWMYALGHFYLDTNTMKVPYADIARSLLTIIAPTAIGLIIRFFLPKVADKLSFFSRFLSAIFVIFLLSFGTYVNFYMYAIMVSDPFIIPCAILLPCLGYSFGFSLAKLARRDNATAATISIETGVQNASIPIIILQGNFPQPEGDLAAVMPVASGLFYNIPIIIAWIAVLCYRRRHPKSKDDELAENGGDTALDDLDNLKKEKAQAKESTESGSQNDNHDDTALENPESKPGDDSEHKQSDNYESKQRENFESDQNVNSESKPPNDGSDSAQSDNLKSKQDDELSKRNVHFNEAFEPEVIERF